MPNFKFQTAAFYVILLMTIPRIALQAQSKCNEDSIMTIKGKWTKGADANMVQLKSLPHIISRISKISMLFQKAYPQPIGTQPKWWGGMRGAPMVDTGPVAYYFGSLYFEWYCNQNSNKLMLEGETGNHAHVLINHLGGFFHHNNTLKEVKVNNEDVYILPGADSDSNGRLLYEEDDENYSSRTIILTHNNRPPWKPITQSQYLSSLKAVWLKKKNKSAEGYADAIADLNKTIKEYQNNKDIKPADKKDIIASLEKSVEDYKKGEPGLIERITSEYAQKISVIDKYVSEHKQELNKPAILNIAETYMDNFTGKFSEIKNGGNMLVVLDPSYFDKTIPDYVPQLMLVDLSWNKKSKAGIYFMNQIENHFKIENVAGDVR